MVLQDLRNAAIDQFRRRGAADRAYEAFARELETHESPSTDLQAEICACVSRLASTLKPEYEEALVAIDVGGTSVKTFAAGKGISASNAAVRVFRAREASRSGVLPALRGDLTLAITAFATVILLVYMGTFREMAGVAADPVIALGLVRNSSRLVHAILALVLLVVATILAIYKPFGMTPYGARWLGIERAPGNAATIANAGRTFGWFYLAGILMIVLLLGLVIAHHLAGEMTASVTPVR